jgi:hypothetical protein
MKARLDEEDRTISRRTTRRRFWVQFFAALGLLTGPAVAVSQTPGMMRRGDRRQDAEERVEKRGENMAESQDDPLGVRGGERRQDRKEIRGNRRSDRRERVY